MSEQRILFAKYGTAKYISHLDLMHTMERAFLRAGIAIRHTTGFHPHPYVSILLPLPLGFSSQCEIMEFGLVSGSTMEALPAQMNRVLPAGIEILRCYEGGRPFRDLAFVRYEVTLELDGDLAQQGEAAFRSLVDRPSFVVKKRSKKAKSGFTEVDIIPLIEGVERIEAQGGPVGSDLTAESPESGFESRGSAPGFSRRISRPPHRLFRMSPAGNFG